jgi:double-strand break repair protein MRE11
VLLGGDLFHENKPTRKTLVSTLDLLRKYCTGENPVFLEILNDQTEVFRNTPLKKVNYEDPFQSISLPVFSIHGNHDDPSREGVGTALSAMDVLSVSNLVNYIGKCEQVDDIEITPLLLRKGRTMIALYALGAVRDERLNRMWTQKHVKFLRPREDQGRERFLNIFVLHQNRDYGRGSKNCVHESMIPDWMDVVIWGNEHECVPNLVESLVGTFRIYQPGSSVATSLCEGESSKYPKHFGMLEVNLEKFRLVTFPYTQIRSFTYADISLAEEGLDPREPNIEEAINTLLSRKIKEIIREARRNLNDQRSNNLSISSSSLQDQPRYEIKEPQKVLIKLRVDHSGFPTINQQRFGTQFLGEVANPSDLILLTRKKRESEKANPANARAAGFEALRISGDAEALSRVRVEDLVNEALENSHKQLGILTPGLPISSVLPSHIFCRATVQCA